MRLDVYRTGELDADPPLRWHDVAPSKILGIGRNYRAHAAEMNSSVPSEPLMFLKAPSALLPPGGDIVRPSGYRRVDYEGELGVVLGRSARRVTESRALEYVFGYTCINDVTVRDLQKKDNQWTRAKGMDTFCPIGPCIVTGLDPGALRIVTRVNGEIQQDGRTADMIFSVAELIAHASRFMTLQAGDIIATGTPSGVGNLSVGDSVTVEIEGIGVLENRVVDDVE
ncbi:MAG: fumarylacetoacetate hydrolase family protein [Proteobacteria bacterium]|nr:fumarylacetoacetate hydrolase family protein [Pseudomonadota bacterium]